MSDVHIGLDGQLAPVYDSEYGNVSTYYSSRDTALCVTVHIGLDGQLATVYDSEYGNVSTYYSSRDTAL